MQAEVVHHMCTHVVSTPARLATLILVAHAVSMPRLQTATSRYAYREKVNRAVPRRRRILKLKKLQILEFAKLPAAAWLGNQCRPPVANYKRCGLFEHCSSVPTCVFYPSNTVHNGPTQPRLWDGHQARVAEVQTVNMAKSSVAN